MSGEPFLPPESDPLSALEEREVPAPERERIVRQIEEALERRRTQVTPELLAVRPRKRGVLLPVLVNLCAAVLMAAGALLLLWHFRTRQESITLRAGAYVSAEGRLLQTLRKDTEQRLRAKDAEIAAIQGRLRELGEQSAALQSRMEEELQRREQALRQDMEGRLEAERERLASLGTATAAIDRRLQELQRQGQLQMGTEMDSYRRRLEAELAQKEAALRGSQEQAREALAQTGRERRELLEQLEAREAEIRAQFDQERQLLRTQALGAEERARAAEQALRSLQERTRDQSLLEDQIRAHYLRALLALEGQRPEEALAGLAALDGLLQGEAVAALPDSTGRREVDARLIAALRDMIQSTGRERGAGTATADLQGELERVRGELATQRRQTEALEDRLRLAARATAEEARSTGAAMAELQARTERLGSQLKAVEERAGRLAAQLETARADEAAAEQALRNARGGAVAEGREAALKDVMRYLQYVAGGPEEKKALEGTLLALVRQDPLYRAVTREIQLSGPAAAGSSSGERGRYVFLGVVSSVAGGTIVVDPMVELTVSAGAPIQVRRATELDRELAIGSGRVQQLRGGKVTAVMDSGASSPAVRDMVYLERQP